MTVSIRTFVPLLLTLLPALTGCDGSGASTPTAPTPITPPPPVSTLAVFEESGTGFSTSDLRDAQDQILQFNSGNELIWTADGTHLPGYRVTSIAFSSGRVYFIHGKICPQTCAFEVRFGSADGERRAYLTVDYGHDNPGTLVDVEVAGTELLVTQTDVYPPEAPTLSGVVRATTSAGPVPLPGVTVFRGISTGWRGTVTDESGFYEIRGLVNGLDSVEVSKDGYQKVRSAVALQGDTRFDVELAAMPD